MAKVCPVCSSIDYKIIGTPKTNTISINFIDKDYKVVQCSYCLAYFVFPKIEFTDEQWAKLYNSEYFSHHSRWLIHQRAKELRQRFDKALHHLSYKRNIRFLDIGTGEGNTLTEAKRRGWDVTGIDIVDNRIKEATTGDIKFIKGKFLEHEFEENYFDFIYFDSVLEHILTPIEYLLKIKSILKPGGLVYIGVPNEDSLFNDVRRIVFNFIGRKYISVKLKPFDSPYHVTGFNFPSLNYLISKADFEIKYLRNFGRKFDFLSCSPNQKGFWINLIFLLPVEIMGNLVNRDVYFEAYLAKKEIILNKSFA